jgi:hypothetical protein
LRFDRASGHPVLAMDEPSAGTSAPPRLSQADFWTTALGPLPGVAVLLVFAFVALRLARRYVEKG